MRIVNISTQIKGIKYLFSIIIFISIVIGCNPSPEGGVFNPQRAFQDVEFQVNLGPRTMGSEAHEKTKNYIAEELRKAGWSVSYQVSILGNGQKIENISTITNNGFPLILLGAHYDSRFFSDNDPDTSNRQIAVPGANDGASGVAVLLELARILPKKLDVQVQLVYFDAEDNGQIPGYDWIMGSRSFAESLEQYPDMVVIVDMVGDANLNLYMEQNSDVELAKEIWLEAQQLGYKQFILEEKHRILDDHIPFTQLGIPAVDIIDIEYPYWHTTQDTLDKVSMESLAVVGNTLFSWLTTYHLP